MGKREVRIQVPKPNGLMATLGHIYGPILESGSTSYPAEDVELGASQVKSEMLLSWIGECEKEHNKCRDHAHAIGKFGAVPVKLIDVLEKKLVKAESRDRYIALSYMWGKAKMSQANQKNAPFLEAPGGLSAYLDQIPRTIRDAMHVDDPSEKHKQIQQMDLIYTQACLTIVAASGNDASYGLPGISEGSRSSPRAIESVNGTVLMVEPLDSVADYIPMTTYETRGWTFQERILSVRCLIFTDKLAMFQCQTLARTEMSTNDQNPDFVTPLVRTRMSPSSLKEKQWSIKYSLYVSMVGDYTLRSLSYRSDMLNAFTDITSSMTRQSGVRFAYGLPEEHFDSALLWTGEIQDKRHRSASEDFPSWSWTSSIGLVTYRLMSLQESHTVHNSEYPILKSSVACFEIRDQAGFRKIGLETLPTPDSSIEGHPDPSRAQLLGKLGTLHFEALVAPYDRFQLYLQGEPIFETSDTLADYTINDADGVICGVLFDMTTSLSHQLKALPSGSLAYIRLSSAFLSSETVISAFGVLPNSKAKAEVKYHMSDWCIINIMLIRWKNDDVAERMGVGQMHISAWNDVSPTKRSIVLE